MLCISLAKTMVYTRVLKKRLFPLRAFIFFFMHHCQSCSKVINLRKHNSLDNMTILTRKDDE